MGLAEQIVNGAATSVASGINLILPPKAPFGTQGADDITLNHEAQKAVDTLRIIGLKKIGSNSSTEAAKATFTNIFKSAFGADAPPQPSPDDPTGGSSGLAKMQSALGFIGILCFIGGFWAMQEMCPGPFAGKKIMYLLLLLFGGGPVGFVYLVLAYGLKKKVC